MVDYRGLIEKRAFTKTYGQFEYIVISIGILNAPATFQTLMKNNICSDVIVTCLVICMNELLLFRETEEEKLQHIQHFLEILKENQLYVSPKKFTFLKRKFRFQA